MNTRSQFRLIRTADETVLDERVVTTEWYGTYDFGEWTADNAKLFRDDVAYNVKRLAGTIIDQELIRPSMYQKFR